MISKKNKSNRSTSIMINNIINTNENKNASNNSLTLQTVHKTAPNVKANETKC
jgi:hypothetical protein